MLTTDSSSPFKDDDRIEIDVIVPVYNASLTLRETVLSATRQVGLDPQDHRRFHVYICCYDDGSTDDSWELMTQLAHEHESSTKAISTVDGMTSSSDLATRNDRTYLPSTILVAKAEDGVSRGAGFARNRAVDLRRNVSSSSGTTRLIAMLDSDDAMYPHRLAVQSQYLCNIPDPDVRKRTLVGCQIVRDPLDSTWHYTHWANSLSDERLRLEQFREVTLLQPTWMMDRSWFHHLGGYLEAPPPNQAKFDIKTFSDSLNESKDRLELIHTDCETAETLRVAEDTRFFFKHLHAGGYLRLMRTEEPLMVYRHREGQSQSSQTPRKLLLHLRARAFERMVLDQDTGTAWSQFCVWGAGRDGKDFIKSLQPRFQKKIVCIVDVDQKKIDVGQYHNKELGLRIPVVHYSLLARDPQIRETLRNSFELGTDVGEPGFGRINKSKEEDAETDAPRPSSSRPTKRRKVSRAKNLDESILPTLPVVVCVAMYRTGGALEHNVKSIGRCEGIDLWHFS